MPETGQQENSRIATLLTQKGKMPHLLLAGGKCFAPKQRNQFQMQISKWNLDILHLQNYVLDWSYLKTSISCEGDFGHLERGGSSSRKVSSALSQHVQRQSMARAAMRALMSRTILSALQGSLPALQHT